MSDLFSMAGANLLSPMVLSFALGLIAALARSDLSIPQAMAKAMAIYLLFAIGFKGGVQVADHGLDTQLVIVLVAGAILSFVLPLLAFTLLKMSTRLSVIDAAAVAAHYGSISIVTFVAATQLLASKGIDYEGYLVATAAVMESPAIVAALWLVRKDRQRPDDNDEYNGDTRSEAVREILLNGSIVLLVDSFAIGWMTGSEGMAMIGSFITDPFKGVLCLFLLDMGLLAGRSLQASRNQLSAGLIAFAIYMPLLSAAIAALTIPLLGLSVGGAALFMTLAASASYIAVPAALRIVLPEAQPGIYLTASLAVTFPFNLIAGIPIYIAVAGLIAG